MDNLSLLQGIFPTQELNWGLLHCRHILYQLSYQLVSYQLSYQLVSYQLSYKLVATSFTS